MNPDILRGLSLDMIEQANSGHPGMALGCAPLMFVLWTKVMKHDPCNPLWEKRDRFILSNGHGCSLLYSILYFMGYNYTLDDLKNFRQLNSKTPGHPEYNPSLGIEMSTGPLGQGIANGVGMAIACKKLNYDNTIYVMCGDGCLMEGISYEACSLAGHLNLNNLVILYDDNGITIDGETSITFTENVKGRFTAFNWDIFEVNGNVENGIYEKIIEAKKSSKPAIIFVKTTIGYGLSIAGTKMCHGVPVGSEEVKQFKQKFGLSENPFEIPFDVPKVIQNSINQVQEYIFEPVVPLKDMATRESSGIVLKQLCEIIPIIVGSADLGESNKTAVSGQITKDDFSSNYLHYGVREHSMMAIANGISTFGILPVVSTFLVFITYCLAPIRMAALSNHKVLYIFTHDSIFIGEDGPSHQPIESLTILRSIPNLLVIRPCDTNEVIGAYQIALKHNGPTAIILTRQVVPNITVNINMEVGAYILHEPAHVNYIIIATGSEVSLALEIAKIRKNIRVVSMPCCELFDKQPIEYQRLILPEKIKKISIEAGSTIGWHKYADVVFGIDTFGKSGKIGDLKEHFGFNDIDKLFNDTTIVFQGKLNNHVNLYDTVKEYREYADIIISTYVSDNPAIFENISRDFPEILIIDNNQEVLINELRAQDCIQNNQGDNVYYQMSCLNKGLECVNTKYVVKTRVDCYYSGLDDFINVVRSTDKIVSSSLWVRGFNIKYHPADTLFGGSSEKIKAALFHAKSEFKRNTCLVIPEVIIWKDFIYFETQKMGLDWNLIENNRDVYADTMSSIFTIYPLQRHKSYKFKHITYFHGNEKSTRDYFLYGCDN
jgi:transketolase